MSHAQNLKTINVKHPSTTLSRLTLGVNNRPTTRQASKLATTWMQSNDLRGRKVRRTGMSRFNKKMYARQTPIASQHHQ